MDRQFDFVLAQTAWMVCSIAGLAVLATRTAEVFAVVSFIGLLVVTELTAPLAVTPRWRVRVRWVILLCLSVVGYVMLRRVLEITPPGIF